MSTRLHLANLEDGTALIWEHWFREPAAPSRCILCGALIEPLLSAPGHWPLRLLCAHGHEWVGQYIDPST